MLLRLGGLAMASCAASFACPAVAGTPYEIEMICPVGGEEFTHTATASLSTWGSRPDGKPFGSWIFPMPLAECPTNGLVVYREFEDADLQALTALVLSNEYRALQSEAPYYRAQWLYDRLDDGTTSPPWLLMRAAWQVDEQPERKARYQREFAERSEGFAVEGDDIDTLFLRYRISNAWRELGEFERAASMLDAIPVSALDVDIPNEEEAGIEAVDEAENRRYLLKMTADIRALITERNTESEPLALIPEREAIYRCAKLLENETGNVPAFCTADERMEEVRNAREFLRDIGGPD